MQALRSVSEIPHRMIDQEWTCFLPTIDGGMPIGSKTGTGSTGKSRYGGDSGSTAAFDWWVTLAEQEAFWGPRSPRWLFDTFFCGGKNFLEDCERPFLLAGNRKEGSVTGNVVLSSMQSRGCKFGVIRAALMNPEG